MRILSYLKKTLGNGISIVTNTGAQLNEYNDSNLVECAETKKFVTCYITYFDISLISWRLKKQRTISKSSFKVEYKVLDATTCEIQWLKYLSFMILESIIRILLFFFVIINWLFKLHLIKSCTRESST